MGKGRFVQSSFRSDTAPSADPMILFRVHQPSSTVTSSSTSAVEVDRDSREHRPFSWSTPRLEYYIEGSPETALAVPETQGSVGMRAARVLWEKGRYRMMIPHPAR